VDSPSVLREVRNSHKNGNTITNPLTDTTTVTAIGMRCRRLGGRTASCDDTGSDLSAVSPRVGLLAIVDPSAL
jgi:hypothetical protein